MKIIPLILILLLLTPDAVFATTPLLPRTFVNHDKQVCYIGNGVWRQCEKATLGEGWERLPDFDMQCPSNYRLVDSPDWVWSEIESFDTVLEAKICGKTFSKGSPVWIYIIGFTLGAVVAGILVILFTFKRKK